RQRHVGAVVGKDVQQPVGKLHIAVAGLLGLPQRSHEGFVADAVEFARNGFKADIGHGLPPFRAVRRCSSAWAERRCSIGSKRASSNMRWSSASVGGAIHAVQPSWPETPSRAGGAYRAGMESCTSNSKRKPM